jgi:hypothetical protein
MGVEVNYIAVIIAAVVTMVLGFLWYGPFFGKMWMKERGFDKKNKEQMEKAKKEMNKWYALVFVVTAITAYTLAHVMALSMHFFGYPALQTGLTTAFWMWLGFVMPVQLGGQIFSEQRNFKVFAIETSYQLATLLAMGVVIGLM